MDREILRKLKQLIEEVETLEALIETTSNKETRDFARITIGIETSIDEPFAVVEEGQIRRLRTFLADELEFSRSAVEFYSRELLKKHNGGGVF